VIGSFDKQGRLELSASQIGTFEACSRKWALSRVLGSRSNAAAAKGSAVHSVLEAWLGEGKAPDAGTEIGRIAMTGIEHLPRPGAGIVEDAFTLARGGYVLRGRKDLRVPDHRRPAVYDHKTTSGLQWAKSAEDLAVDVQATIYAAHELAEFPGAEAVDLHWIYYTTRAPFRSRKVSLAVLPSHVAERMDAIDATAERIAAVAHLAPEFHPPTPSACEAFGGCPYREECNVTPTERMQAIMSQATLAEKLRAKLAAKAEPAPPPAAQAPAPAPVAPVQAPAPAGGLAAKLAAARAAKAPEAPAPAPTVPPPAEPPPAASAPEAAKLAALRAELDKGEASPVVERRAVSPRLPVESIKDRHLIGGLRDQIAISALNGAVARGFEGRDRADLARWAYAVADAMLEAREA
jgi:hypothetical protein